MTRTQHQSSQRTETSSGHVIKKMPVVSESNKVSSLSSLSTSTKHSTLWTPRRVTPALLRGLEHQRQELSGCSGRPAGAPHTRSTGGAAAVPGSPSPPGGTHPIHRSAEGVCKTMQSVHINLLCGDMPR